MKIGSTSIAITIPHEFAKKYKIDKNGQVSITSRGRSLILRFKEGGLNEKNKSP
jgi:hypothetical protein